VNLQAFVDRGDTELVARLQLLDQHGVLMG